MCDLQFDTVAYFVTNITICVWCLQKYVRVVLHLHVYKIYRPYWLNSSCLLSKISTPVCVNVTQRHVRFLSMHILHNTCSLSVCLSLYCLTFYVKSILRHSTFTPAMYTPLVLAIDRLEEPFGEPTQLLHGRLALVLQSPVLLGQPAHSLLQ